MHHHHATFWSASPSPQEPRYRQSEVFVSSLFFYNRCVSHSVHLHQSERFYLYILISSLTKWHVVLWRVRNLCVYSRLMWATTLDSHRVLLWRHYHTKHSAPKLERRFLRQREVKWQPGWDFDVSIDRVMGLCEALEHSHAELLSQQRLYTGPGRLFDLECI